MTMHPPSSPPIVVRDLHLRGIWLPPTVRLSVSGRVFFSPQDTELASSPTPRNHVTTDLGEPEGASSPPPVQWYKRRLFGVQGNLPWGVYLLIEHLGDLHKRHLKAELDLNVYLEAYEFTDLPLDKKVLKEWCDVVEKIRDEIYDTQEQIRREYGQHWWIGEERNALMRDMGEVHLEVKARIQGWKGIKGLENVCRKLF